MSTKRILGLKDVYVAEIKQNDEKNYICDTPFKLARSIKVETEVKKSTEKIYSDSELEDVTTVIEEGSFSFEGDSISSENKAKILNKKYEKGILMEYWDEDIGKKEFAVMYRLKLAENKFKYVTLFCCKFGTESDKQSFETADSKSKNTTETITATFKQRTCDLAYRCSINANELVDGAVDVEEAKKIIENFYAKVPGQVYNGAPLTEENKPSTPPGRV